MQQCGRTVACQPYNKVCWVNKDKPDPKLSSSDTHPCWDVSVRVYTKLVLARFFNEYRHLNRILLSREAIRHNHTVLSSFNPQIIIGQVLKSNAYGHGLKVVAPEFDKLKLPFLFVDSLYEAYELSKISIKTPVFILGYTHPANYQVKKLPFVFAVNDWETAEALNRYQPGCSIHLFIDTGMCREGIVLKDFRLFLKRLKKLSSLKVDGLASHLTDAENSESNDFTDQQTKRFETAYQIMLDEGYRPAWRHLSASAGLLKIKRSLCNLARIGLAGFGINPLSDTDIIGQNIKLKPALSFVSTVAQIKTIPANCRVGYQGTFVTNKKMVIGIIPAGYYDGIDRRLSNRGVVKIKDYDCPIVGRVSMNITTVDISRVDKAIINDEVEIISNKTFASNSLANLGLCDISCW